MTEPMIQFKGFANTSEANVWLKLNRFKIVFRDWNYVLAPDYTELVICYSQKGV